MLLLYTVHTFLSWNVCTYVHQGHRLGTGIKANSAGIGTGIPRHLSPVPEHSGTGLGLITLVPNGICIIFHSGTRLTGCRTVRHYSIYKTCTKSERRTSVAIASPYCWWLTGIHPARPQTAGGGFKLTLWWWQIISKCRNARKKSVRHRNIGRVVSCVSIPVSGPVRYHWSLINPHCPLHSFDQGPVMCIVMYFMYRRPILCTYTALLIS